MKAIETNLIKWFTYPLIVLIVIFSAFLLYLDYIAITNNLKHLFEIKNFPGILFLTFIAVMFPAIIAINKPILEFEENFMSTKYFFGLLTFSHKYSNLKINDIQTHSAKGIILEFENGDIITLAEKQYKNYVEIKNLLNNKSRKDSNLTYRRQITRPNGILILVGITILILFVISQKFNF